MTSLPGRDQSVLYLDFDGVLSHERVLHDPQRGPYLDAPERYSLFQYAPILVEMLEPHAGVLIVLSTSWAQKYGLAQTVGRLPPALQRRVVGATGDVAEPGDLFGYLSRGEQVALDVERRRPSGWLALDDDMVGWPKWTQSHVIFTDPYEGVSPASIQAAVRAALAQLR